MTGEHNNTPETARHHSMLWLTSAALYFLLAAATIRLTSNGRDIATLWPANAVLLALLLTHARSSWIGILTAGVLANSAANIVTRGAIAGPLVYGLSNVLEVVVAALLFGRRAPLTPILGSSRMVGRFLLVCGLIAPSISGFFGAMTAWLAFAQPFAQAFRTWLISDALGLLIFTPVFLAVFNGDILRCFNTTTWAQRGETFGLLALTAASAYLVFFHARAPLLFMLFAPVMLVTFRVGRLGTKMAVMLVAIIGGYATLQDLGPIAAFTRDHAAQTELFQIFLAVLLLTCLPVAADLAERRSLTEDLARREREMSRLAATDSLTGMMSRSAFERHVSRALEHPAKAFTLVAIDLDFFKSINDQWGHQAGDRALIHAAKIIQNHIRGKDAAGRMGGDEFLLFLRGADTDEAKAICERIRTALRKSPIAMDDKTDIMLSLSCGIAQSSATASFHELYHRADKALYMAKFAGRNTVRAIA
ncbi:MAG: sensor domain-containing diguanylate cyclase [Sphingomonadales bacterium]|nr:sensor domain-containing diguanylate cyclase [Sphingomonadales bacterium]MDE2169590.1 sensor domain-containing diguanylate cyclase [Sphingomonadales bacterium]